MGNSKSSRSPQAKKSKFLSYVLRHNPGKFQLEMDDSGWVSVEDLLKVCAENNRGMSHEELTQLVENNDKKRFAFSEDGQKIRASQGHSLDINLGYEAKTPPETLFHGTAVQNKEAILKGGLKKMQRHHVHLSANQETASAVGKRYGKLLLFKVKALQMHNQGHPFFCSENQVWLTDHVPPEFLEEF